MSKLTCAILAALFVSAVQAQPNAIQPGAAQSLDAACEAKAVNKEGKPLSGAARKAALKKCETGKSAPTTAAAGSPACEAKAVSKKTGKKLHGAAKQKFMEKCMRDGA